MLGRLERKLRGRAADHDRQVVRRAGSGAEGADLLVEELQPGLDDFADIVACVRALREQSGLPWEVYDVIVEADSTGELIQVEPAEPQARADAGATWWVESWWSLSPDLAGVAELHRRVAAGPPS